LSENNIPKLVQDWQCVSVMVKRMPQRLHFGGGLPWGRPEKKKPFTRCARCGLYFYSAFACKPAAHHKNKALPLSLKGFFLFVGVRRLELPAPTSRT
jgi:hypothetical protein